MITGPPQKSVNLPSKRDPVGMSGKSGGQSSKILVACKSCGHVSEIERTTLEERGIFECTKCGEELRVSPDGNRRAAKDSDIFDNTTGIRRRFRQNLGFKNVGLDPVANPKQDPAELEAEQTGPLEVWDTTRVRDPEPDPHATRNYVPLKIAVWSIIAILVAVGMIVLFNRDLVPEKADDGQLAAIREPRFELVDESDYTSAEAVVRKFLKATEPSAYATLVRDPDRIVPLAGAYYNRRSEKIAPIEPLSLRADGEAEVDGKTFVKFTVRLTPAESREIFLEKTGDGYRVDWESFVAYSDMEWREFKEADPRPMESILVRARISLSDNYKAPYDDKDKVQSLYLVSPGGNYSFTGYVDRKAHAVLLRELETLLEVDGKPNQEAILRIRYPKKTVHRFTVEIVDYVANGWALWER